MTSDGLFVSKWGEGPDVVFLHGLGASSRYWETLASTGGGYRATAPDLLGFGRSPSPADALYDLDCHLNALERDLPERSVVVAHSTGAIVAAGLALRHPECVRSMLLLGLPAFRDQDTARREIGGLGLLARLTVDRNPAARILCEAMCRLRPLAIVLAPWVVRDLTPSIASDGTLHSWPSYSRTLLRVVIEHPVAHDLLRATSPVTLLHGRSDRTARVELVETLVDDAADAGHRMRLLVVEGDHHLALRRPKVVAETLADALTAGDMT